MEIEFSGFNPEQEDVIRKYRAIVMCDRKSYFDIKYNTGSLKGNLSKLVHKFLEFSAVFFDKENLITT